jgi:hypothetical protein
MERHVDAIVEEFYAHILTFDEVREKIPDAETLSRLKTTQREYLLDICRGLYDEEYFERRLRIGIAHEDRGIAVEWFLGGYATLFDAIAKRLSRRYGIVGRLSLRRYTNVFIALVRLILFDAELMAQTYIASLSAKIRQSVASVSTAMEQFSVSSSRATTEVESVARRAHDALSVVDSGTQVVALSLEGISRLRVGMDEMAQQIANLSARITQIRRVTDVVGTLASETNLLALNAKVEAVRAGTQGTGFGVIASRVRELADASRVSVEEINEIVGSVQKATDDVVRTVESSRHVVNVESSQVESAGHAFSELANVVRGLSESIQGITLNLEQQTTAVNGVVEAIAALRSAQRDDAKP